jgi:hypothetical protein
MRSHSMLASILATAIAGCDLSPDALDGTIPEASIEEDAAETASDATDATDAADTVVVLPDVAGERGAPGVTAVVRPSVVNVVSVAVDVSAHDADEVYVEHGLVAGAYTDRTPTIALPASGRITIPVLGLRPAVLNHLRVTVTTKDGATARTDDLPHRCGVLPYEPKIEVTTGSDTVTEGFILTTVLDLKVKFGLYVVLDRKGRILWYWAMPPSFRPDLGSDFRRVGKDFVLFDPLEDGFLQVDLLGNPIHAWPDVATLAEGMDAHEFLPLPSGDAVVSGWDPHTVDSTPYFGDAGAVDATRRDQTVDELDVAGKVVFHWSSYPEIGLDEIDTRIGGIFDGADFQVTHTNGIELLPDGNFLASHRSLSALTKLDRTTAKILWRLGGKKSDFTFVDDPLGGFSAQHDPRILPDGHLQLVDNGNRHVPPVTRIVEYVLDEKAKTATLVRAYHHDPEIFSAFAGSARRLPDGHTLIAYAQQGIVTEIDASQKVVWEAKLGASVYRAVLVPALYP